MVGGVLSVDLVSKHGSLYLVNSFFFLRVVPIPIVPSGHNVTNPRWHKILLNFWWAGLIRKTF